MVGYRDRALIFMLALTPIYAVHAKPDQPTAKQQPAAAVHNAHVNGVTIAYRVAGSAKGDAIVLLPGIGMQLTEWPQALIDGLTKKGFRVIMPDLRDSGESTHFESAGQPDWGAFFAALQTGKKPPLAYTADDMSNDVLGLMDVLQVKKAHLLGISGGATIAEIIAMAKPDRVKSLTLIAANSGNPAVAIPAKPAAFAGQPQPKPNETHEETVARKVGMDTVLAGGGAVDENYLRANADRAVRRDNDPFGTQRQGIALLALGDLRSRLSGITASTTVIHGADDPLIPVQLGREVAETIPGAKFHELKSMGHNLPAEQISFIIQQVVKHAKNAR